MSPSGSSSLAASAPVPNTCVSREGAPTSWVACDEPRDAIGAPSLPSVAEGCEVVWAAGYPDTRFPASFPSRMGDGNSQAPGRTAHLIGRRVREEWTACVDVYVCVRERVQRRTSAHLPRCHVTEQSQRWWFFPLCPHVRRAPVWCAGAHWLPWFQVAPPHASLEAQEPPRHPPVTRTPSWPGGGRGCPRALEEDPTRLSGTVRGCHHAYSVSLGRASMYFP